MVFDRVSWSNTPMFHNTLVVSSSPTSSTTQSPETGELLLCRKPLLAGLFVQPFKRLTATGAGKRPQIAAAPILKRPALPGDIYSTASISYTIDLNWSDG